MRHPGKLITLEGLDGVGKSTQLKLAAEHLRRQGLRVRTTHEPGGTAVGQQIRDLVVSSASGALTPLAELALMFAARAQHIEQVILPALEAGEVVLSDRFTDSSVAYQGYGRGVPLDSVRSLEEVFCQGVRPDLTLILDLEPEAGVHRAGTRNLANAETASRFEREGLEFFRRVREGYREIARQEPARVRMVDAGDSVAEVRERVLLRIDEFLRACAAR